MVSVLAVVVVVVVVVCVEGLIIRQLLHRDYYRCCYRPTYATISLAHSAATIYDMCYSHRHSTALFVSDFPSLSL